MLNDIKGCQREAALLRAELRENPNTKVHLCFIEIVILCKMQVCFIEIVRQRILQDIVPALQSGTKRPKEALKRYLQK